MLFNIHVTSYKAKHIFQHLIETVSENGPEKYRENKE